MESSKESTAITKGQWKTEIAQEFVRDARESKAYSSLLKSVFAMTPSKNNSFFKAPDGDQSQLCLVEIILSPSLTHPLYIKGP